MSSLAIHIERISEERALSTADIIDMEAAREAAALIEREHVLSRLLANNIEREDSGSYRVDVHVADGSAVYDCRFTRCEFHAGWECDVLDVDADEGAVRLTEDELARWWVKRGGL